MRATPRSTRVGDFHPLVIPEYKVNLEKLIDLLMTDKRHNPSNYALVILSEGAQWKGYQLQEYGEPDAYGHRKKASIAETSAIDPSAPGRNRRQRSDLRLRGRCARFHRQTDRLDVRHDGLRGDQAGKSGLMAAIHEGCYAMVPLPDPKLGPRRLDVATMYNTARYRPNYSDKLGLPVFLTRA